jgi:hypothetical protein
MRLGRHLWALGATGVGLLAGIWLMVDPWVLAYPRPSGGWGPETLTDFWTGLAVVVVSGVTLVLYGVGVRAELEARGLVPARPRPAPAAAPVPARPAAEVNGRAAEPRPAPPAAPANLDEVLVPIATALLTDLVRRRAAQEAQGKGAGGAGGEGA